MRMSALAALVIISSWLAYPRPVMHEPDVAPATVSRSDLVTHVVPTAPPVYSNISTGGIAVSAGSENGPLADSGEIMPSLAAPSLLAEPSPTNEIVEGSLLPKHRVLLIYGLPGDPSYGSLGSYDNLRMLEVLEAKVAEYQAVDPSRPIILGIEIIASLAQKSPGGNGNYIRDTSVATIYSYIEFTRAHGMVLFLDVQMGRRSVPEEVQRLQRYLQQPHVHLAVDPEFDVGPEEIPTIDIGRVTAADIRWTQDYLVQLSRDHGIPPKILIVHQFTVEMIVNKSLMRPVRGVQLVIDVSLWGTPQQKRAAYEQFVTNDRVEFGGIMVSGTWDNPAMSAEDVINLPGAPDIVIYQ